MTGMVISLPENMLGENRKEIRSIEVEGNFSWKTKGQTVPMVTFVDVIRANWTSIDMKAKSRQKDISPVEMHIVRLFHDIVSSTDREVNQDTGSKSTEQTA
jgi:hypothetical protein